MKKTKYAISMTLMIAMMILASVSLLAIHSNAQALPREETVYIDLMSKIPTPDVFNPYLLGETWNGITQVLAEFFFITNLETGETVPWLAEGYDLSSDFMNLTLYIREGVEWSDGTPLTADDVVFTINMLKDYAPQLIYSSDVEEWIDDVYKIDDHTVKFVLTKPDPRIILRLFSVRIHYSFYVLPKHIWEGEDPTEFKFSSPVFTGPYKLVSSVEDEFVYERRDDWWAIETGFHDAPEPKYAVFKYWGEEEKRVIAMARGDADSIHDITTSAWLTLKETTPTAIAWYEDLPYCWLDPCPRYMGICNKKYPWSLREVRWALSYAIDREEIVRVAYENSSYASPHQFPFYPPLEDPYLDAIEDLLAEYPSTEFSLTKSEEMFLSIGFHKEADGFWYSPNMTKVEMVLDVPPFTEKQRIAAVLVGQLKTAGIDCVLKMLELGPWADSLMTAEYEGTLKWCCGSVVDPYFSLDNYHSKWSVPVGTACSTYYSNTERFENTTYDAAVDALATTSPEDEEECVDLFHDAMESLLYNLPFLPITQAKKLVPFNTLYWTNWPTAENNYVHPPHWWASTLFIILNLKSTTIPRHTLTLSAFPAAGGTTTPPAGTYEHIEGDNVTVTISVTSGYEFDYWELDGVEVSEATSYTVTMDKDHTLRARLTGEVTMDDLADLLADVASEIAGLKSDIADMSDDMADMKEAITDLTGVMGTLSTLLYATIAIEVITLLVAVVIVRKRS